MACSVVPAHALCFFFHSIYPTRSQYHGLPLLLFQTGRAANHFISLKLEDTQPCRRAIFVQDTPTHPTNSENFPRKQTASARTQTPPAINVPAGVPQEGNEKSVVNAPQPSRPPKEVSLGVTRRHSIPLSERYNPRHLTKSLLAFEAGLAKETQGHENKYSEQAAKKCSDQTLPFVVLAAFLPLVS